MKNDLNVSRDGAVNFVVCIRKFSDAGGFLQPPLS
jgi:hypothetical protein